MASLDDLMAALDERHTASMVSSVRQPQALRRALMIAVDLGLVTNANEAQSEGLRSHLEALAQRAALDEHYRAHPVTRPRLAEVALALAELDHSRLATRRELIEQAAHEVAAFRPSADADDGLLWAASLDRQRSDPPRRDPGRRECRPLFTSSQPFWTLSRPRPSPIRTMPSTGGC